MYIAKGPINKIKILCEGMIGLEKSFQMILNAFECLDSRETVPLIKQIFHFTAFWNHAVSKLSPILDYTHDIADISNILPITDEADIVATLNL